MNTSTDTTISDPSQDGQDGVGQTGYILEQESQNERQITVTFTASEAEAVREALTEYVYLHTDALTSATADIHACDLYAALDAEKRLNAADELRDLYEGSDEI